MDPAEENLARKRAGQPLHPPGRDVRCIVSVGMLTEGWDCSTVTHIVGLRPFMSQLLCEQVVGRGLRRRSYDVREVNGKELMTEEVAKVFGVPFQVIPFKASGGVGPSEQPRRRHVYALPGRATLEIRFPRVEGYRQAIRNRVCVHWEQIPPLWLDPMSIPPEVQMKASLATNSGRPSLMGPGRLEDVTLNPYRRGRRLQELVFELASDLTRDYVGSGQCEAPPHVLFPQLARVAQRFVDEKVIPVRPAERVDLILETKSYDELAEIKAAAAERWVAAVNVDHQHGIWEYRLARSVSQVRAALDSLARRP